MGEAHLVAALTWTADFDLREKLDQLRQTFPVGWRGVDENLLLQVCKGLAGLDITKSGQTELVRKLTEEPALLDRAGTSLKRALDWISENAGVVNEELLPYAFQVVLLALELARHEDRSIPDSAFSKWFWRTSWSEVFATAAFREVKAEQEFLQRASEFGIPMPWAREQPLPVRFDFRSARVRLFVLRLANRQPEGLDTEFCPDGRHLLAQYGREAFIRLFPVPRNAPAKLKRLLQGVGNRFLIDPNKESVVRDRLKSDLFISSVDLADQFIDDQAITALRHGDLTTFIERRTTAMETWDQNEWIRTQL